MVRFRWKNRRGTSMIASLASSGKTADYGRSSKHRLVFNLDHSLNQGGRLTHGRQLAA